MKPTSIILLLLANLICESLLGINLHYVNSAYEGKTYTDKTNVDKVIEINSENPKSLKIFDLDYSLDAPYCSVMTSPNRWKEYYLIKKRAPLSIRSGLIRVVKVGVLVLCKEFNNGVIGAEFRDNRERIHLFRPRNGERIGVTHMPALFFNRVEFASVGADGEVINNYGSMMESNTINGLKIKVVYQRNNQNEDINLHFRVVNKNDAEITDKNSTTSCSTLITAKNDGRDSVVINRQFNKQELKLLEKWCRIEIYDGKNKLCSKEIPICAQIAYRPVLMVRIRPSADEIHCEPFNPGNSSLGQPMLIKQNIITFNGEMYRVLKWLEIEM